MNSDRSLEGFIGQTFVEKKIGKDLERELEVKLQSREGYCPAGFTGTISNLTGNKSTEGCL